MKIMLTVFHFLILPWVAVNFDFLRIAKESTVCPPSSSLTVMEWFLRRVRHLMQLFLPEILS